MKIAIVQFPGSNCERETINAVKRAGMEPVSFLWNENVAVLEKCDGYIIVGGFSYEDRSRAGVIASIDPVMQEISRQANAGKLVLGICNGAQILVESGLVPGNKEQKSCMALADNKRIYFDKVLGTGFYNAWVNIKLHKTVNKNAFTTGLLAKNILRIPTAHAQGRFCLPEKLLKKLIKSGMVVFQYCDDQGKVVEQFPTNPNGSVENIAAVSNYAGNVLAIMPHPERTENGDAIFSSMRDFLVEKEKLRPGIFDYQPEPIKINKFSSSNKQLLIDQVLADNEAISIQLALKKLKINASVKRYVHWELDAGNSSDKVLEKIIASEQLFNPKKEFVIENPQVVGDSKTNTLIVLVRAHEDFFGQQKFQLLANHFEIDGIKSLNKSTVWQITSNSMKKDRQKIIDSGLLFSPASQHCHDLSALFSFNDLESEGAEENLQVEE